MMVQRLLRRQGSVATSVVLESSAAVTVTSIEGAADTSTSRYLDIPGSRNIYLDATELLRNDQEILEAVTKWVFVDPSLLDAIVLDPPVSHQDGDAGGSAPSAAPEAAEGFSVSLRPTQSRLRLSPRRLPERPQMHHCSSL